MLGMDRTGTSLEFFYQEMAVGVFAEPVFSTTPGRYRYEPYRGLGHYEMKSALQRGERPTCSFRAGGGLVSFVVVECPEYGVLQLDNFGATNT